ncbi:MAG: hypothetical protein U5K84_09430 [Alkalibacterium sp.]|nr:hypothetical protein [Alkalibacterium sp.]
MSNNVTYSEEFVEQGKEGNIAELQNELDRLKDAGAKRAGTGGS